MIRMFLQDLLEMCLNCLTKWKSLYSGHNVSIIISIMKPRSYLTTSMDKTMRAYETELVITAL